MGEGGEPSGAVSSGTDAPGATDSPAAEASGAGARIGAALRDVLEALALAAVIFVALQFAIQNTVVEGSSMEPNFVDGQRLLVNKLAYQVSDPQPGDVIVFHAPWQERKDFIKRVVATPGETVRIQNGRVYVDDARLAEPWGPAIDDDTFGPYVVPEDQYFVLGDNRSHSNDSRTWQQALQRSRIVGRVALSVWPPSTWGLVRHHEPDQTAAAQDQ